MRNKLGLGLLATTMVCATLGADERTYTFKTVDVTGAIATLANGIGSNGELVGAYRDAANRQHGFLLHDDAVTTIDFPGAALTDARGIGHDGTIVGLYRYPGEPAVVSHGYTRTPDGLFQPLNYPGHISTIPQRILANGTVLGCYHDTDTMGTMHGIAMDPSGNSEVEETASMSNGGTPNGKVIVGLYTDMTGKGRGYLIVEGVFEPFDYPGAVFTAGWDMNQRGSVVGVYQDTGGRIRGFLWEKGEFVSIDVPGARVTRAFGINARGDIAGTYIDASNRQHAFVASRNGNREE